MFEALKKRLKYRRLQQLVAEREREVAFRNFGTARHALIFCVEGDFPAGAVEQLRQKLGRNLEVNVLIYTEQEEHVGERMKEAVYVYDSAVSGNGRIEDPGLSELLHFPYDLLIDLSVNGCPVSDYMLRQSRALCKLGMARDGFECDIVFEGEPDIEQLTTRMLELLNKTKTC